jgi:uncharacterized protein (TIGR02186 family)
MKYLILTTLCLTVLMVIPASAQDAGALTVDLAKSHVDIATDFEGDNIYVFGTKNQPGEIVIVLQGPKKDMTIRRKSKIFGAWMNRQSVSFRSMPSFYSFAASKELDKITSTEVLKRHEIAPANISIDINDAKRIKPEDQALFTEALLRNKQAQGLYSDARGEVHFLNRNFFKASFYLPPNVPVGDYEVKSFFIRNGQVYDIKTNTLRIAQVGMSSRINSFSKQHSFVYGILCVGLAVFSGWVSGRLRRQI